MKIQDLFAQYLYQQKTLSIPGLGVFELNPAVNVYETKEEGWPENTINFKQDKQAPLTEDFLNYLVKHTGKMKSLAISDLESYVSSGMQLLNIGKPFMFKGIGSVSKSAYGDLLFQQGMPIADKLEGSQAEQLKDRTLEQKQENDIDFTSEAKKNSKKPLIIFASILALGLIAWAIYLAMPKKEPVTTENETETTSTDTVNKSTTVPATDTLTGKKDSATNQAPVTVASTDTTSFDLVIDRLATKEKADAKLAFHKSRNRELTLVQKDSSTYQLVLHVTRNLSDTTHVIDSLKSFYNIKASLLKKSN